MATTQPKVSAPRTYLINELAGKLLLKSVPAAERVNQDEAIPDNREWLKSAFMLATDKIGEVFLAKEDRINTRVSSATLKYTDSSPGGNIPINPPTQFTRYADIRDPGLHAMSHPWLDGVGDVPNHVSVGMFQTNGDKKKIIMPQYGQGRYYSETIDDNSQVINLRFGVATFNSASQFFTGFYSSGMATAARTARFTDDFWAKTMVTAGRLIGIAIAPLFLIPMCVLLAGSIAKYALGVPSTKFYYLKPSMPLYWTAVSSIVNQMSSLLGLTNDIGTKQAQEVTAKGDGMTKGGDIQSLTSYFINDGWMDKHGLFDVRNIASRSKRLQHQFNMSLYKVFNSAKTNNYSDLLRQAANNSRKAGIKNEAGKLSPEDYVGKWKDSFLGKGNDKTDESMEVDMRAQVSKKEGDKSWVSTLKDGANSISDFFVAEVADGSDWLSLRVDYTGATSESFNNSTTPSSLQTTVNGMSSSSRQTRTNMLDGNIIPGMGAVIESVKNVVSGVASVAGIEGLAMLAGSAFIDIPENWESSVARLPTMNYSIKLISPYGNPISQMIDIYMPLACLLAGTLPLATGAQSWTSPFLVQLHDPGRGITRLGIIDSLSVSRGTSNVGFDRSNRPLAIDVTFGIKDLSTIVSVPISASGFDPLNPLEGMLDDQTAFADYMMAMTGIGLGDMIYRVAGMKYRFEQKYNDIKSFFSASHIASALTGIPGVGLMNAVFKGTNR